MVSTEQRVPSVWLLGLASGLSPFGMAIIVPSLASIAVRFDADFATVQFVISAYLFGLAVAQPINGFLCDRFGRRVVMLTGFAVCITASILCATASSLEQLIAFRFFQAAGVSVGTVASRAVLRDTRSSVKMTQAMSYIAAIMGVAPVVGPILGGLLDATVGYQWIFVSTAVLGVIVFVSMLLHLDETLDRNRPTPRMADWLASYRLLARSRPFIGNTLVFGFVQGSFFSFMAIGAAFFFSQFRIEADTFGLIWGVMSGAYIIGASLGARYTPIMGTDRVMHLGVGLGVAAGLLVVVGANVGEISPVKILLPLSLMMVTAGAITPGAMAGAVVDHPTIAGTASGLSSAAGLVIGGAFTIIAGSIYQGSFTPIAWLMLGACVATAASWLLASLPSKRSPTAGPTN